VASVKSDCVFNMPPPGDDEGLTTMSRGSQPSHFGSHLVAGIGKTSTGEARDLHVKSQRNMFLTAHILGCRAWDRNLCPPGEDACTAGRDRLVECIGFRV